MIRSLIFCMAFGLYSLAWGQYQYFENVWSDLEVQIDTTLPGNRWMIGRPQKVMFDSAYSLPNAIVTDTLMPYPAGQRSVFEIRTPIYQYYAYPYFVCYFYHKMDADSLHAGGWIEASYDQGQTWTHLSEDTVHRVAILDYGMNSTLFNGKKGFTGSKDVWRTSAICWGLMANFTPLPPRPDEIRLRFVYESDSASALHEGWMIDNFEFWIEITHVLEELKNMSLSDYFEIYPNPVSDYLLLFYRVDQSAPVTIRFFDLAGKEFYTLNKDMQPKGVYYETLDQQTLSGFPPLFFIRYEANGTVIHKKVQKATGN